MLRSVNNHILSNWEIDEYVFSRFISHGSINSKNQHMHTHLLFSNG